MNPDDNSIPQDIPEMYVNSPKGNNVMPENPEKMQKEMEKTKKELEKLKSFILKKYPDTQAISILPPQAIGRFIEEEEVPKETEKYIHLQVIFPEDKFKEIPKIKQEIIKQVESLKQKIWLHIKTPLDIWEVCMDSKFDLTEAIAMSMPLHDEGILGALRVATIHKSLVLQKFERYVVSYVVAGSLVRGEAIPTSDVDVVLIIDDTDIKRMPRLELKERLRGLVYQYIAEATALAGVKNKLEPQIYLLTEFWESVKDANPVMFTFIRDGVPLYDRRTFMPWKALLKMGKLKPSPEAIDMFMSVGEDTVKIAKRKLLNIVVSDIYWSVITPSQGLLMLYGLAPPTPKETVREIKKIFMDKEKMLEKKYVDILEEIVIKYYKGYEHEKIKEVSGKEIDKLIKNVEDYLKRLGELRGEIEKRAQEKTIEQIHGDIFDLLKSIFGKKSQSALIQEFEKSMVKKGKFTQQHLRILNNIVSARNEFKKGKSNSHKVDLARKDASILIGDLIEFSQRKDLAYLERGKMKIKYMKDDKEQYAELLIADGKTFLFDRNLVRKITDKAEDSSMDEVSEALKNQKSKSVIEVKPKVFELLKKELGEFEIIL
jgi:predicted nucleotidyltransferase/uncharacterized protein (UPF0332 family)